jgi:hypothetical protein
MSDHDHGDRQDPVAHAPQADNAETSDKSYKVGYGRPPTDRCFKPGRSGNPKGRPKGRRNAKTVVTRVVNEKVTVRENGRTRKVTKFEAMVLANTQKAMKGDTHALNSMIGLMVRTNQLAETEVESLTALPEDDAAIVADFLRRQIDAIGPNPTNDPEHSDAK